MRPLVVFAAVVLASTLAGPAFAEDAEADADIEAAADEDALQDDAGEQDAEEEASEEDAEERGLEVKVGEFPCSINGLAMARNELEGSAKIVSDAKHGEILGVHIVGTGATELIGEAVLAMQLEATANELARGIRLHPSFSETVVDAARAAAGWALYLPKA